jgi:hypothetical protein
VLADCRAKTDGFHQIEIERQVSPPLERSASYWNPSTHVAASHTLLVVVVDSQTQTISLIYQDQRGTKDL